MISSGMKQVYKNWINDIDLSIYYIKGAQTDADSDLQNKLKFKKQLLIDEKNKLVSLL